MSSEAKRQYAHAISQRYRQASRAEKPRILDEFCQVAGYHRKSAIRLLNGPPPGRRGPPLRRPVTFGHTRAGQRFCSEDISPSRAP